MAYPASQVINDALVDLGALKPGATPSTTVQNDCLARLQNLWAGWGIDPTISNAQYHQTFNLFGGQNTYTLGTGGTLNTPATPTRVYGAESVSGNFRSPVKVVSFREFDEMATDALGGSTVLANLLAADNSYPLINLRVFPVPSFNPGQLVLDFYGQMMPIPALTTDLGALAPGYLDALHFNLAMALLPQYGRQGIDATAIAANAASTLQRIQVVAQQANSITPAPQGAQQ